jgi:hypothetical protein
LGLLPPLIRSMQLKQQLAEAQTQIDMAETRELAALSYLEATRNNYGNAATHTSHLFDRLGKIAQSGEEPARSVAVDALRRRDTLMGMLAKADPGARAELQTLLDQMLSTTSGSGSRARTK